VSDDIHSVEAEHMEGLNPLHEKRATGEIAGRDYSILIGVGAPVIVVQFDGDDDKRYRFHPRDLVTHAYTKLRQDEQSEE